MVFYVSIASAKGAPWRLVWSITGKQSRMAARGFSLPTPFHYVANIMNLCTVERRAKNKKRGTNI